jgi:hypothetical protein
MYMLCGDKWMSHIEYLWVVVVVKMMAKWRITAAATAARHLIIISAAKRRL